jgi:hypothetical protein
LELYYNSTKDGSSIIKQELLRRRFDDSAKALQLLEVRAGACAVTVASEKKVSSERYSYYRAIAENTTATAERSNALTEVQEEKSDQENALKRERYLRKNPLIGKEVVLKGLTDDNAKYNGATFYVADHSYLMNGNKYSDKPLFTVREAWTFSNIFGGRVTLKLPSGNVEFVALKKAKSRVASADIKVKSTMTSIAIAKRSLSDAMRRSAAEMKAYRTKYPSL